MGTFEFTPFYSPWSFGPAESDPLSGHCRTFWAIAVGDGAVSFQHVLPQFRLLFGRQVIPLALRAGPIPFAPPRRQARACTVDGAVNCSAARNGARYLARPCHTHWHYHPADSCLSYRTSRPNRSSA